MSAFNLQDSATHNLTAQEIVIRMIDYDEPASNLYYQTVLDRRVKKLQQEYECAAEEGEVPEELQVALDHAKRDCRDALRYNRELYTVAEEIVQGLKHPTLVLLRQWFIKDGIVAYTIHSAYYWAKAHGKEVPEWAPPNIQSPEAPQQREAIATTWDGVELKLRAANKMVIKYADGQSVTKDLEGTGILNTSTKILNTAGAALLGLASNASIPMSDGGSEGGISSKVMSGLRSSLKELAGIDSDPFFDYNPADGWKPRFQFRDRRNAAEERAKEKAGHDSYEDGVHGSSSFDEYPFDPDDHDDPAARFLAENGQ